MRETLRKWWPYLKLALFVLVLVGVGYHFWRILHSPELQGDALADLSLPGLALSGLLYLMGLAFAGGFWLWLMAHVGQRLPLLPGVRAYYLSHLGKYVPGKGLPVVIRTVCARQAGAHAGVAALTAVYETLTLMAAGAMVAAVLVALDGGADRSRLWQALGLFALAGIPILPGVFHWIVRRLSKRFLKDEESLLPRLGASVLLRGLALTACGWFLMGGSLLMLWESLAPETVTWDASAWLRCTTMIAVSYVGGFVASTPGGLGAREFLLQQFLAPRLGARAVVVVLLLRLAWTLAELLLAAVLYFLPREASPTPETDLRA